MTRLAELKRVTTKPELAVLLGVKASFLTNVLYRIKPERQYIQFKISKKTGGNRIINAPTDKLKRLQSCLSNLLLDCVDDINRARFQKSEVSKVKNKNQIITKNDILKVKLSGTLVKQPSLAHGFTRNRSVITNAMMHVGQKNVLNIDLKDFFDSFNFGRVRGFFIRNKNFELDPHIATVIAKIACYKNKLPQGSPCSPVITNLITHSLDISLASLAEKHSCIYTRYADDITISTRKSLFPTKIMRVENGDYFAGNALLKEINRAGFTINEKKTRIQFKDSRQDVTGLVVNEKPNVKKEYWRNVKAQCHSLFQTGAFTKVENGVVFPGNVNELEGRLNFIDQVDFYNRLRQKPPLNPLYTHVNSTSDKAHLLSGREKTFRRFLYYRLFYANSKPTILCEGKTDNVYLKAAISKLVTSYPKLARAKTPSDPYELLVRFVKYTKRTRFLLELEGGTSYLNSFIRKYDGMYKVYGAPCPVNPVIIVADNDSGFSAIQRALKSVNTAILYPKTLEKNDYKNAHFIHVVHNLYVVLTPLGTASETAIEDLFDGATRAIKVNNKSFNPKKDFDKGKEFSKEIFANKVVKAKKSNINFDGFKPLLDRVVAVVDHYDSIKA